MWQETEFEDLQGLLQVRAEMNGSAQEAPTEELTPWDAALIKEEKEKAARLAATGAG